jgi:hypothetical protein
MASRNARNTSRPAIDLTPGFCRLPGARRRYIVGVHLHLVHRPQRVHRPQHPQIRRHIIALGEVEQPQPVAKCQCIKIKGTRRTGIIELRHLRQLPASGGLQSQP